MNKINIKNYSESLSTFIGDKSGDLIKYTKENAITFIKNIPIIFKSLLINTQSILISLVIIIILCGVFYLLYTAYKKYPRTFGLANNLPIAGSKDNKPKSLDLIYYEALSKSLAYYVYENELPIFNNVFNKSIKNNYKKNYLKYINNKIFFHKQNSSYKYLLNKIVLKYNTKTYNQKWGSKSLEGLKQFFMDILTKNFNLPIKNSKKNKKIYDELTDKLNKTRENLINFLKNPIYKKEFENNLQKVINDNIYSFINAFNYINNQPQNDYILNTYGKFVKIQVSDNQFLTLKNLLKIPIGSQLDLILTNNNQQNDNKIILNQLNQYLREYDDISNNQPLDKYILQILNNDDPISSTDFNNYILFLKEFNQSNNDLVNSIYNLSGIPNKHVNIMKRSKFDIDIVTSERKYILNIYQDIIIYQKFKTILKKYPKIISNQKLIQLITKDYNWHLERLAHAQYFNGENIVRLFNDDQINKFMKITSNILDLLNYPLYKNEMSYGLFAVLYIYLSQDSVEERLKHLSNYYMSFSEMYLAIESLEEFETLKNNRDNINLFKDYLKPAIDYLFIEQIYKKSIKSIIWEDHYKTIAPLWNKFRNGATSLSTYIDCQNKHFKGTSLCPKNESFDNGDIIEEFNIFGPILKPITTIVDFVKNVTRIVKVLLFAITNPLEFLKVLIGLLLYIFVNIFFIILNIGIIPFSKKESRDKTFNKYGQSKITLGRIIFSFFYRILWLLPIAIFNSSIYFLLFLVRLVLVLVFVILDFITMKKASKIFYSWFVACENSPFAWFENSFYQKGNKVERDLICKKNCPSGYTISDDGNSCVKIPNYIPNYCPQAQLMRIYKGMNLSGPININQFKLPKGLNKAQQEKYIEDFKKNKKDYYESCQNLSMLKYDNIAKSICSNLEFTNNSNVSQEDIKNICYNKFCRNGNHQSFCAKLNDYQYDQSTDVSTNDIIKFISVYTIIITLLSLGIYIIDQKIDLINKANQSILNTVLNIKNSLK